ncbi:MAG: CinA family protein [Anaerolineae bacterium]|nr:CinA family protein [Anaerolineae bacterium]
MTEQKPIAERVATRLAERNIILGTVECATGGTVSHRLFETDEGPTILGDSLSVDTIEDAVDLLGLPEQQFKATGTFSAKAARSAARAALEFLEVRWCLVVWAEPLPAEAATAHETIFLALNTGADIVEDILHYDGPADGLGDWLAGKALGLVWRALS